MILTGAASGGLDSAGSSSSLNGSLPPSRPLTIADMFAMSASASKSKSSPPIGAISAAAAALNGSPLM